MVSIAIVCHPCTPAPAGDLEEWLAGQLEVLRQAAPGGIIRLLRLVQDLPDTKVETGWLVELELPEESVLLGRDRLADALADLVTDMRFLGLQPRVMTPRTGSPAPDGWKAPSTLRTPERTMGPWQPSAQQAS